MKEASYKIFTQQHSVRFFAPKKFECKLMQDLKGVVCYKGQQFYTSSIINQHYIFTKAGFSKEKIPTKYTSKKIKIIAKASFGFGDVNGCVIFKKY